MDAIEIFLNRLHHPKLAMIDMSLERMHRLLAMLGSPQRRLPPVLHVAGTNGKGSLLAYLHFILEAAGYRVHRYISPHLVHFKERIQLQGKEIDNGYLESIIRHMGPTLAAQPATFFEATTAAAFIAFADKPADILLLETGLGGRLDATNVIEKPLLTAITPIAFDHMEYLGATIEAIAAEKAGIIKRGVPCVIGKQGFAEALAVLEKKATELGAPLFCHGQHWHSQNHRYVSDSRTVELQPSLPGEHQYDNAATAVACLEQLPQFKVSDAHIAQGLAATRWPARLQQITQGRLAAMLPEGVELWLDGGHNPQGGQVLADWLASKQGEVHLVCGMIGGKDPSGFLAPLAGKVTQLYGIKIPAESNVLPPEQLVQAAGALGIPAQPAENIEKALQAALLRAKTPAIICICGSLYLAGKVLAANGG